MADEEVGPMLATASLGELLVADRATVGVDLDELSRHSGFAVERIEAVESGRHDLSDAELCALLDDYSSLTRARRPFRALVEIDLDAGSLRLRKTRRPRALPAADRNLLHYLSILHRHNGLTPGAEIPLKAVDLSLLRASLALRRGEVASRLDRMAGAIVPGLTRNRSLLAVAFATGLVVAAGAIVLIPSTGSGSGSQPEPANGAVVPRIDIGTPLVIERDPADIPAFEPSTGGSAGQDLSVDGDIENGAAPTVAPAPRIGTALVIERGPSTVIPSRSSTDENGQRGPPIERGNISR